MPRRRKVTVYVLHPTGGGTVRARQVGDQPPKVKVRYRGVGSRRRVRKPPRSEIND